MLESRILFPVLHSSNTHSPPPGWIWIPYDTCITLIRTCVRVIPGTKHTAVVRITYVYCLLPLLTSPSRQAYLPILSAFITSASWTRAHPTSLKDGLHAKQTYRATPRQGQRLGEDSKTLPLCWRKMYYAIILLRVLFVRTYCSITLCKALLQLAAALLSRLVYSQLCRTCIVYVRALSCASYIRVKIAVPV